VRQCKINVLIKRREKLVRPHHIHIFYIPSHSPPFPIFSTCTLCTVLFSAVAFSFGKATSEIFSRTFLIILYIISHSPYSPVITQLESSHHILRRRIFLSPFAFTAHGMVDKLVTFSICLLYSSLVCSVHAEIYEKHLVG
jgi:hypothetical protein